MVHLASREIQAENSSRGALATVRKRRTERTGFPAPSPVSELGPPRLGTRRLPRASPLGGRSCCRAAPCPLLHRTTVQKAGLCCSRRVGLVRSPSPWPETSPCCTATDGELHSSGTFRVTVLGFPPAAVLRPSIRPSGCSTVPAALTRPARLAVWGAVTLEATSGGPGCGHPTGQGTRLFLPPALASRPPRGCRGAAGSTGEPRPAPELHRDASSPAPLHPRLREAPVSIRPAADASR